MSSSGLGNRSVFVERAKILNLDTNRTDSSINESVLSNWVGEWKYIQFDPVNNRNVDVIITVDTDGTVKLYNVVEGVSLYEPTPMQFTMLTNSYGLITYMDLSKDDYIIADGKGGGNGKYKAVKTELYLDPSLNKVGVQFTFKGLDTSEPTWEVYKAFSKQTRFAFSDNGDVVGPLEIFEKQ